MTLPSPAVWLDNTSTGVQLPTTALAVDSGVVLGSLRLAWGRRTTRERVDPTTLTFDFRDPAGTWAGGELYLSRLVIIPGVFVGRFTDIVARHVPRIGQVVRLTATDPAAEWANVYIGSTPYPHELAYDRAQKIRADAGMIWPTDPIVWPFGTPTGHDATYNPYVRALDVDRRTFRELLDALADTIECVVRFGRGPRIVFQPKAFEQVTGAADVSLTASQVLLESDYVQTVADLATRVAIGYFQGATDAPEETTGYYTRDTARDIYGERTFSIRTERHEGSFGNGTDLMAERILNARSSPRWRMPAIRTTERLMGDDAAMSRLLDAIGAYTPTMGETLILVSGMPGTVPVPESHSDAPGDLYMRLLGGTYTHDGQQWEVTLHTERTVRASA